MTNKNNNTIGLETKNKIVITTEIKRIIKSNRLKQREVAKILDIKQPRVSDLLQLKIEKFSLDLLVQYLSCLGVSIDFGFDKRNNLKISVKRQKTNFFIIDNLSNGAPKKNNETLNEEIEEKTKEKIREIVSTQ